MKQETNNEMDLLLKTLAKNARESDSALVARQRLLSDHLDADELNVFAEGLVPDAARSRYSEHLAECENCRGIVVVLSQAAGISPRTPVVEQQTGAGIWMKVAALFTPQVLRYAVPAIAFAAVIAITFIALRQRSSSDFVAQRQPVNPAIEVSEPARTQSPEGKTASLPAAENARAEVDASKQKALSRDVRSNLGPAGTLDGATASGVNAAKDSAQPGQAAGVAESRPVFAPEPPAAAPAPPAPRPQLSDVDRTTVMRKKESAEQEAQQRQRGEYSVQADDEAETNRSTGGKTAANTASAKRVQGLMAGSRGSEAKNKNDSAGESETRSLSGKTFRRQGNAWVDAAYDSSRATTNVSRGSEQYRALVADEPGLRAISEQLSGEVVVVWKGRAYRIR